MLVFGASYGIFKENFCSLSLELKWWKMKSVIQLQAMVKYLLVIIVHMLWDLQEMAPDNSVSQNLSQRDSRIAFIGVV